MRFRLKFFGLHLLASLVVLTSLLGALYLGWYRWPGWYLADAAHVIMLIAGVDVVIGPALTFVVASALKPRRELTRDVAVIAAIQLCALLYGTVLLWSGRPLYYAFSENVLQLVQAYDIDSKEIALARQQHAALIPHWYSLRGGSGHRCPRMPGNTTRSSRPRWPAATMSSPCRATTGRGMPGCRCCAPN